MQPQSNNDAGYPGEALAHLRACWDSGNDRTPIAHDFFLN